MVVLLQTAPTITLTDQGVLAFFAILLGIFAAIFSKLSSLSDRMTRMEVAQEMYFRSTERNRKGHVVTDNPLTRHEKEILNFITSEGGSRATWDELEIAARACYREGTDPKKQKSDQTPYLDLLPTLDARKALVEYEQRRRQMPWWKRLWKDLMP